MPNIAWPGPVTVMAQVLLIFLFAVGGHDDCHNPCNVKWGFDLSQFNMGVRFGASFFFTEIAVIEVIHLLQSAGLWYLGPEHSNHNDKGIILFYHFFIKVSSNHIMPPVSSLSELLPLDPLRDQAEIKRKQAELQDECERAQDAIKEMNSNERQNFNALVEKRLDRLTNELEAVLPPIPASREKAIKKSVDKGMKAVEEKEQDKVYHQTNTMDAFCDV